MTVQLLPLPAVSGNDEAVLLRQMDEVRRRIDPVRWPWECSIQSFLEVAFSAISRSQVEHRPMYIRALGKDVAMTHQNPYAFGELVAMITGTHINSYERTPRTVTPTDRTLDAPKSTLTTPRSTLMLAAPRKVLLLTYPG